MSSLFNFVTNVGADLVGTVTGLAGELINGTPPPTTILDPVSTETVIRKPPVPLCVSIPGGVLEEGTLILMIGTPNQSFNRRFHIDFIVEKCEHALRLSEEEEKKKKREEGGDTASATTEEIQSEEDKRPSVVDGDSILETEEDKSPMVATSEDAVIAFHFNPRFGRPLVDSPVVVMNSRGLRSSGQGWGPEVRPEGVDFPFTIGRPFQLMILVERECFRVAVDGRHCYEYRHRIPDFKNIGRLHVGGALSLDLLEFRKELKYLSNQLDNSSSSSSSYAAYPPPSSSLSARVRSHTVTSPTMPYREEDARLGGATTYNVYIAGLLPKTFRGHFVVNLLATKLLLKTIAFHMSVRPEQKMVVRNSMIAEAWREEELYLEGRFPFELGAPFDLMIAHRPEGLSVAVNGQMAFEFQHRMDASLIDALEITGAQVITSIQYEFY